MRIPGYVWLSALGAVLLLVSVTIHAGLKIGEGKIANAESKLPVGCVYECVTSLVNINNEGWYAVVKMEEGYLGLRFQEQPPIKGVVAEQDGKIVFLPLASSGTTIPNPLPAEKPEVKAYPPSVIGGRSRLTPEKK